MKIAILGDTHFGMRNDSVIFHDLYSKFYSETFFPYLKQNNIKLVIQLGDLFDRRKYINFNSLALAKKYFFDVLRDENIELYTLIGNHDIFYKNTLEINSTSLVLKEYQNISIFDKPTEALGMDIIPWVCENNEKEILEFIENSKNDICFGHFELAGFEMDRGNICHEGWDSSKLSKYDTVFTGHFHHRSKTGNIFYVGSPGEMTWSDYNDPRGFHIFDTVTREVEFIENTHTIFRKFNYNDDELFYNDLKKFDFDQFKGKYVKVVVTKKTNTFLFESFVDGILKSNPHDLSIVEDFSEITASSDLHEVDQADDTAVILDKYIDSIEIDLNKDKLKSIIKEIYTEALSIES